VIAFDHRERRSGVPQRLSRLGLDLEPRDLGSADYVLSPRLAVVRKTEAALAPWVALGRFDRALEDVRDNHPAVVVVLQRAAGAVPDGVRRSVLARLARRGIPVLEASDADEAAGWIARLAREEARGPEGSEMGMTAGLGRKPRDPDRVAEDLVARLPGVGPVGARRLLAHFGSVRALAGAGVAEIDAVPGFGPKRAGAVADALGHHHGARPVAA
jgi:ERCC4-type nuclease